MNHKHVLSFVVAALLVAACDKKTESTPTPVATTPTTPTTPSAAPSASAPPADAIDDAQLAAFKPALPANFESKDNPSTDDKVLLGRTLYFDTRLSAGGDLSCNSCHKLDKYGVDGAKTSEGHKKQLGKRNSPTVFNAAGHFVQFWDGRAKDVEEQAKGPVLNPVEMAMKDDKAVVAEINKSKWYKDQFKKAFPQDKDPVSFDNMAKAIAAFERKLVTPSKWDKFLGGDKDALSKEEKAGFNTFVKSGCTACHSGTLVGGTMFQKLGIVQPWKGEGDLGKFEVTKKDEDKLMFKVPSLRNVEKTAPYFHDGSIATLEDAITQMGKLELGKDLTKDEVASIVVFLKALTGEPPKDLITEIAVPDAPKKK